MTAVMVVVMNIHDPSWIAEYFAHVPALLEKYGAAPVAAGTEVRVIEGESAAPDRVAVFSFPSMAQLDAFMADPEYQAFRAARMSGSDSAIYVMENVIGGAVQFA